MTFSDVTGFESARAVMQPSMPDQQLLPQGDASHRKLFRSRSQLAPPSKSTEPWKFHSEPYPDGSCSEPAINAIQVGARPLALPLAVSVGLQWPALKQM